MSRPLFLLQLANLLGSLGNATVALVVPWLVLDVTGSPAAAGAVAAVGAIPGIFIAPFVGALVDWMGRRRVSVGSDLLSAGVSRAVPGRAGRGRAEPRHDHGHRFDRRDLRPCWVHGSQGPDPGCLPGRRAFPGQGQRAARGDVRRGLGGRAGAGCAGNRDHRARRDLLGGHCRLPGGGAQRRGDASHRGRRRVPGQGRRGVGALLGIEPAGAARHARGQACAGADRGCGDHLHDLPAHRAGAAPGALQIAGSTGCAGPHPHADRRRGDARSVLLRLVGSARQPPSPGGRLDDLHRPEHRADGVPPAVPRLPGCRVPARSRMGTHGSASERARAGARPRPRPGTRLRRADGSVLRHPADRAAARRGGSRGLGSASHLRHHRSLLGRDGDRARAHAEPARPGLPGTICRSRLRDGRAHREHLRRADPLELRSAPTY